MFAVGSVHTGARTVTRVAGLALAGLALTVALLLTATSPAQAKPTANAAALPKAVTLKSLATGYVLDSNYAGDVYGLKSNGGTYQKWIPAQSDHGTITLTNKRTKRCLDSDTKGKVYTLRCNGGSFQKWFVQQADFGTIMLRNLATGRVLDGDATRRIYALPKNGGSYQKWTPLAG
jgi:serine/threonine-protein kinase